MKKKSKGGDATGVEVGLKVMRGVIPMPNFSAQTLIGVAREASGTLAITGRPIIPVSLIGVTTLSKRSQREVERNERKGLERLARRIKKSSDWSKVLAKIETDNAHLEGNDE